jgi:acyl-CoA thioesterase-1
LIMQRSCSAPAHPARAPWPLLRALLAVGWLLLGAASHAGERQVLVLGDSISAAYGMSLDQGWVALLADSISEHGFGVVNASISGETSAGGLRRLPGLLDDHNPALVIIELGGNDGLRGYPLERFEYNLLTMAELSRDAGAGVVIVPMEIPPNYGARYTEGFRRTFGRVAEATGSTLAPFILSGVATDPALMQPDGIHPTAAAQPTMLDTVLPAILGALPAAGEPVSP